MPKQDQKLKLKRTVDQDALKTKPMAPSTVTSSKYSIDNASYRGMRTRIKIKNPKGYSGREQ